MTKFKPSKEELECYGKKEILTFLVIRSSAFAGIGWNGMHGGENTFDLKNLRRHFKYPSLPPVDRRRLLSKTSLLLSVYVECERPLI